MPIADLIMCLAWLSAVAVWHRAECRVPRFMQRFARVPRTLIQAGGWGVIIIVTLYSLGGIVGGSTQVEKDPVTYAARVLNPARFWSRIARQQLFAVAFGAGLIGLGRAPFRRRAASANNGGTV